MSWKKIDITFDSEGSRCAGWFFVPEPASEGPALPGVAMAHGLGAVKEMYLEPFAERFAAAGIAVLLFDYRYFGASEGEPRERVSPRDQLEDYRNALTWLSLRPEVDEAPCCRPLVWRIGEARAQRPWPAGPANAGPHAGLDAYG